VDELTTIYIDRGTEKDRTAEYLRPLLGDIFYKSVLSSDWLKTEKCENPWSRYWSFGKDICK